MDIPTYVKVKLLLSPRQSRGFTCFNYLCQWFQVELTLEQQVRSTGYGQPPECMGRDDILVPLR